MIEYGVPLLTVLVAAGLVWLAMRRARRDAPQLFERRVWHLVADDEGLRVRSPTGGFRELAWDDVGAVQIRTANVASEEPVVDWVFESASGGPPLTVPHGADGVDDLLRQVPAHLDGFVYERAIGLVRSSDVAELDAWRRADRTGGAELAPGGAVDGEGSSGEAPGDGASTGGAAADGP
jgi:hypothetical protein